jgi:phosphoglycolate phosphatase
METLLEKIESKGLNWGIVTNKPAWLTDPLVAQLNLTQRAISIISGDTIEHSKPHPAPMLLACEQAGSEAHECLYIGDAERDIIAGKNAGMKTLVALFGYIGVNDIPDQWNADGSINHPLEILDWL